MSTTSYRRMILADSPTHYWPCEDVSGTITDLGSNPVSLTVFTASATVTYQNPGPVAPITSLHSTLLGAGASGDNANLNTTNYSYEAWFRQTSTDTDFAIISNWASNGMMLYGSTANSLVAYHNGAQGVTGASIPTDGSWHHYAVTWDIADATAKLRVYKDGVQVYGGSPSGTGTATGSATALNLGYYQSDNARRALNASVCHAAMYQNVTLAESKFAQRVDAMRRVGVSY